MWLDLTTRLHLGEKKSTKYLTHADSFQNAVFPWTGCQSVRQFIKGNGSTECLTHMSLIHSDQVGLHVAST